MVLQNESNVTGINTVKNLQNSCIILKNIGLNQTKLEMSWKMGRNVLVKQKTAKKLARFSKNLFSEKIKSYQRKIEKYLTDFSVLKLSKEHILECENVILEKKKS